VLVKGGGSNNEIVWNKEKKEEIDPERCFAY
jgi:hypothetical protein